MMKLIRRLLGIKEKFNFMITYKPIKPHSLDPSLPFLYHTLITATDEYSANRLFDTDPMFDGFRRIKTEKWELKLPK
jgi:hypothetical protein